MSDGKLKVWLEWIDGRAFIAWDHDGQRGAVPRSEVGAHSRMEGRVHGTVVRQASAKTSTLHEWGYHLRDIPFEEFEAAMRGEAVRRHPKGGGTDA